MAAMRSSRPSAVVALLLLLAPLCLRRGPPSALAPPVRAGPAATEPPQPKAAIELLKLLDTGGAAAQGISGPQRERIFELVAELEAARSGPPPSEELSGLWRLLFQGAEGPAVSALSLEDWRNYFLGDGPSPVQSATTASAGSVYQRLELEEGASGSFLNLVDFSPVGCLEIGADLEGEPKPGRLAFRFQGGEIRLAAIWNGTVTLPYPVPFALLGDRALGWLETLYLDSSLRVSRGNKGSLFVLRREDASGASPLLRGRAEAEEEAEPAPPAGNEGLTGDAIVLCPAQFGTPGDYEAFAAELRARGHPVFAASLTKLSWFELVPSFFSADYWMGELKPSKVLQFYYRGLEEAVKEARAFLAKRETGGKIHLVAHSIGGWVVRAFMGEVLAPRDDLADIASLVTLGTPHGEPPKGSWLEAADQTRGLLKYINREFPGAFHKGVRYISVGSGAVPGALPFEEAAAGAPLERLLGWASYLALCGEGGAPGDGITPLSCALLPGDGVERLTLEGHAACFHADFLPSPGPSVPLRGTSWYGTGASLDAWLPLLK